MTASALKPTRPHEVGEEPAEARGPRLSGSVFACLLVGLVSSTALMLTGSRLADRRFHWWFRVVVNPIGVERALFYTAMGGLVLAWLGLARVARTERLRLRSIAVIALIWCIPLLVGPPLFSHDLYSYLAQGTIAHLGLSPYHYAPSVLGTLGHHRVLSAVDPFWRRATAPYGPLFLGVISLIAGLTGSHVFAGVVLVRLFDFVGLVLLAMFVPRLARRAGADPTRAVWLAVASPLILLELVAPGHNDLLMAGVMVAGIALALDGRPVSAIVVCALAATIKLPAATAAAFVAVAWVRAMPSWREKLAASVKALLAAALTAAVVTLVTGFGLGWISTSLFSTPGRVRLAITPATDISFTIAKLLHDVGASVSFGDVEPVLRGLLVAASVIVALVLLAKTRWRTLIQYLGLTLIAFAIGGPALWPWYLAWGLVLLAAWRPAQRSRVTVALIVIASFVVRPDGILLLSRGSSPVIAAIWVAILIAALLFWRRRGRMLGARWGALAARAAETQ